MLQKAGLDGVVASPQEAQGLRSLLGDNAAIVTPGVRSIGCSAWGSNACGNATKSFDAGASHLVIGRPITEADVPVRAFDEIVKGL